MAKNKATDAGKEIDDLADVIVNECRDYLSADEPDVDALRIVVSRRLRDVLPALWEWSSQELEIERLRLQRFTVRVQQDGSHKYNCYTVECHGEDDAKLIAFALDGGWPRAESGKNKNASGMLELAKMYCDVIVPDP